MDEKIVNETMLKVRKENKLCADVTEIMGLLEDVYDKLDALKINIRKQQ